MSYRHALNVFDLQAIARRRLPYPFYSYIEGGVEDNQARLVCGIGEVQDGSFGADGGQVGGAP